MDEKTTPVRISNYLKNKAEEFCGNNKPYNNITHFINEAVRDFLKQVSGEGDGEKPDSPKSKLQEERKYFFAAVSVDKLEEDKEVQITQEQLDFFKDELQQNTPSEFLTRLTVSFVPHIVENHTPKLLCLLVAVGAIDLEEYRKEIHGYLVGNPGTGKSDLIKGASKLRYKSIYADAPNASSRGLVYGQEEFQRHKILKAGLLVRNELVCLDELDKFHGSQRKDINTVLEQQIAGYHKAGFDKDTPTAVSLLGAGNPYNGRWNDEKPLMDNLSPIEPELLSRMMIVRVFKTKDTSKRIKHILSVVSKRDLVAPPYSQDQIAAFVSHCRKLHPAISPEAEKEIISFLEKFEQIEQDAVANLPIETRQEIEIIRISTAFAKMLLKDTVDAQCVKIAIQFFRDCMATLGIRTDEAPIQMDLQGTPVKRKEAFWKVVNELTKISDDGSFTEFDVLQSMSETVHWNTPEACRSYWERMLNSNKFFEPAPGRYKRV